MKSKVLYLFFALAGIMLFAASCAETDPNEETNDMLNGNWEAISFIGSDNIERITGDATVNSLVFTKDSIDGGTSSWDIVTPLLQLEGWSGRYSISNSGNRLTFGNKLFAVSFEDDNLHLSLLEDSDPFDLVAKPK